MSIDWIETPRGVFRYELAGPEGGAPLVLIHEMGGSLETWDHVFETLAGTRRVLRYDVRGFGMSVKVADTLEMADWVEDLAALLDGLGLEGPCDIAGVALNGATALAFAAAHPARTRRVIAMSPATGIAAERQDAVRALSDRMAAEGMRALSERNEGNWPETLHRDPARFEAFRLRWQCNDPRSFAEAYRMLLRLDMSADLPRIACPVLLVGARHDPLRPPETTRALLDVIPGAQYREVESGHFLPLQTPDIFLDLAGWFDT
ncbi:MAG: alpha/beta fold hydrolase [Pseudooceanicola sp.]